MKQYEKIEMDIYELEIIDCITTSTGTPEYEDSFSTDL